MTVETDHLRLAGERESRPPALDFDSIGYDNTMKTTQELFQILDESETLDGHRSDLLEYLVSQLEAYEREPEKGEEIAYEVAGLMGTKAIMNLAEGDPYGEVLALAGELELPVVHRDSSSTWARFATLVRSLQDKA